MSVGLLQPARLRPVTDVSETFCLPISEKAANASKQHRIPFLLREWSGMNSFAEHKG